MLNVAVFGASGYAGVELLRLLHLHPEVKVTLATSEKSAGKSVNSLFPHLTAYEHTVFEHMDVEGVQTDRADLFFLALPHKTAQKTAASLFRKGKRVIDLSADFRLRNPQVYEQWYQTPHTEKAVLKKSIYGLPELYRAKIRRAKLVANPGCYPTGAVLGLIPALRKGLVEPEKLVIDSKSGVSGAGRAGRQELIFCEVSGGFKAYSLAVHRHTPEIEQELSAVSGSNITLDFTPHLVPMNRGILTTIYAQLVNKKTTLKEIHAVYRRAYAKEPFVRVLPIGEYPFTKNVQGTNFCHVGLQINPRTNRLLVVTAIDNLTKGAAGQALQNMNIMMGYDEMTGINSMAVFP